MKRLNAIETIDNNDPVVFNYPEGDSVYMTSLRNVSVYDVRRQPFWSRYTKGKKLRVRPVDKRDHYVKRCLAVPGNKFEIKDRQVYINEEPLENPSNVQFKYVVNAPGIVFNKKKLNEWEISDEDINNGQPLRANQNLMVLNQEQMDKVKATGNNITFEPLENKPNPQVIFPHDPKNFPDWSIDNYGPITIPAAGATVDLSPENIAIYERIIEVYEGPNEVSVQNGKIHINGSEQNSYTFKQDYYWMMGDNRHNSEDSRYWGFVPHDHIVGKPLFIWFSTKEGSIAKGIRWSRLFSGATKM